VHKVDAIVVLLLRHGQQARNPAKEQTRRNGNSEGNGHTSKLVASLHLGGTTLLQNASQGGLDLHVILEVVVGGSDGDYRNEGAEDTRNRVQEVNATSVVKIQLVFEDLVKLKVAESANCTSASTGNHTEARAHNNVGGGAHHDTTGEG